MQEDCYFIRLCYVYYVHVIALAVVVNSN